jgi:lipid II:glycine glycyltransferase (peptidoglycan interpeptide bridge formation enzyme)
LPAVAAALADLASSLGAATVEIEPNAWEAEADAVLAALGRPWRRGQGREPAHTAVVDLGGGWEAVLSRMRPHGRRNVRIAERRGVEVSDQVGAEAVATLAGMAAETASRQGIALPGAGHYHRVLAAVPSARVHVAHVEGEAVAAVLVAAFAAEAIYLYGGSTLQHRERQPSAALHARVMREAIASGCHRYDLWGIPPDADPAHPWHGLRQFKLALGGVEMATAGAAVWARRPLLARTLDVAAAARAGVRLTRRRLGAERRVGRQDFA